MELRTIHSNEINEIANLLKDNQLPYKDIITSNVDFLVAIVNNKIVGCIGLEKHNEDALLRSFAVNTANKGKGIGQKLLNRLLKKSKAEGVRTVHLLTTTAKTYFTKNNFHVKPRKTAPLLIQKTTEFSDICPASSTYMVYNLNKD